MLLNKHSLALASLASREESRFTLSGIQVTTKETRVTDGHIACWITHPPVESERFPEVDGFKQVDEFEIMR